jgi:hypothetical protein
MVHLCKYAVCVTVIFLSFTLDFFAMISVMWIVNDRVLLCLDLLHHLSRKWNCLRKLSKQNQPLDLLLHHPNLRLASGFVIASPRLMSGQPLDNMSLLSLILRYGQPPDLLLHHPILRDGC